LGVLADKWDTGVKVVKGGERETMGTQRKTDQSIEKGEGKRTGSGDNKKREKKGCPCRRNTGERVGECLGDGENEVGNSQKGGFGKTNAGWAKWLEVGKVLGKKKKG